MHAYNNGESQNDNVESKSQVAFKRNPKSSQTPIGFLIYNRVALKVKTESRNLIKQTSTNLVYLRTLLKLNFNNIFNSSCNIVYLFPPIKKKTPESICFGPSSHLFNLVLKGEKMYISTLNSQFSPMLCRMVIKSNEGFYIHSLKLTFSHLKMDDWKTILPLFWSKKNICSSANLLTCFRDS